jgi:hypothetical protein
MTQQPKIAIKISPSQAITLMRIENEILNSLWKDSRLMTRLVCFEILALINKFERISTGQNDKTIQLNYTQCVSLYVFLLAYPINDVDALMQVTIRDIIDILHKHLM